MKEQTQNMRTVCDVLGEAQDVMQQLTKKLRNSPEPTKLDTKSTQNCNRPMQSNLGFDEQALELPPSMTEELPRFNIGTQVNFGKKTNKPAGTHIVSYNAKVMSTNGAPNENPSIRAFEMINQSLGSKGLATKKDNHCEKVRTGATKNSCTTSKCPGKIQTIPPVDVPRLLVTQNIPVIVVSAFDDLPQVINQPDSNVGFLIVKHSSEEDQSDLKEIASEKQVRSVELQSPKQSDNELVQVQKEDMEECGSVDSRSKNPSDESFQESPTTPTATRLSYNSRRKRHVSVAVDAFTVFPEDDYRDSVTSSSGDLKTSTCNELAQEQLTESTNSPDGITAEFRNHQFKSQSESELSNLGKDDYRRSSYDTLASRKSNFAEFLFTRENEPCKATTKEFIKEMTKDPYAKDLYKSYQLMADQSAHEPDEEVDDAEIASIDEDVYKTFVNPNRRPTLNRQSMCKYLAQPEQPEQPAPTKTPFEFYATKSTQCDEIFATGSNQHVQPEDIVMLKDSSPDESLVSQTYLRTFPADDNVSDFIPVANDNPPHVHDKAWSSVSYVGLCDDQHGWRNNHVKPHEAANLLQPSPEAILAELDQARSGSVLLKSVNKYDMDGNSTRLHEPSFSNAMDAISFASLRLANRQDCASNSSKGFPSPSRAESTTRPRHKHASILEELDANVAKKMADAARRRDSASNKSENTEDVIFEIDREILRLENDNLTQVIDEISLAPSHLGKQRMSLNQRYSFIGSNTDLASNPSDYVVTHDISMQTSLANLSEVVMNSFKYSKQAFDKDVESLKVVMAEDDETAPNTSCFARLCWSSKKKERKHPEDKAVSRKSLLAKTSSGTIALTGDSESMKGSVEPEVLSFPERVRRRLSRRPVSPVESFISGLTNVKKGDIAAARNAPPQPNALNVFDDYKASEVMDFIKTASKAWTSERGGRISTQESTGALSQTPNTKT